MNPPNIDVRFIFLGWTWVCLFVGAAFGYWARGKK